MSESGELTPSEENGNDMGVIFEEDDTCSAVGGHASKSNNDIFRGDSPTAATEANSVAHATTTAISMTMEDASNSPDEEDAKMNVVA